MADAEHGGRPVRSRGRRDVMPTCLVVDDSEAMREILADHLSVLGHEVREVGAATEAVAALESAAPIAVVFLDWDLPALGALDVLRAAASMPVRPEIVLCATEHDPRQLRLASAAGARHHVLKPFDARSIAAVMAEIGVARAA